MEFSDFSSDATQYDKKASRRRNPVLADNFRRLHRILHPNRGFRTISDGLPECHQLTLRYTFCHDKNVLIGPPKATTNGKSINTSKVYAYDKCNNTVDGFNSVNTGLISTSKDISGDGKKVLIDTPKAATSGKSINTPILRVTTIKSVN